jgi:hypothetical protein
VNNDPVNFVDLWGLEGAREGTKKGVDINLFHPESDEELYTNAQKVKHPEGTFIIGGHGSPSFMQDANGKRVYPSDLADLITAPNSGYQKGDIIILDSCNTGVGNDSSFAQRLANELGHGTIVKAPDNYLTISKKGEVYIGPARDNRIYYSDPSVQKSPNNSGAMLTFKGK